MQTPNTINNPAKTFHPVINQLFLKKNFSNEEVAQFLSWDLLLLPDLTKLKGLGQASARIITAMNKAQVIGIYGDYDVDGTSSCALLFHFFQMLEVEVHLFQPSRFVEGYGLHTSSIDTAKEAGVEVLITVDCGITSDLAAAHAKQNGIDLIITDHHQDILEKMPQAFCIINPNRRDEDCDSPLKHLAGVGVAFCLALQIKNDIDNLAQDDSPIKALRENEKCPSIYPLLQFVALGTICDQAQLTPMNLKLVRHGIKQMQNTQYAGIKAFFAPAETNLGFIPSEKLSFNIGPMINSKGRVGHPEVSLKLLTTMDSTKAYPYYAQLEISNKERKHIQAIVFKEAYEHVLRGLEGIDHTISIVYAPSWHEGVIGIVASKLVDTFKVPAIVFTDAAEAGVIKASARSAGTLDIFSCLKQNNDLFIKFGGHKAAAGLSMKKENFTVFKTRMESALKLIPRSLRINDDSFDLDIRPGQITPQLVKELELLEPYGNGNEKPIFRMSNVVLKSYKVLKDLHVRWSFGDPGNPKTTLGGITFNYIGKWQALPPEEIYKRQQVNGDPLSVYFTLAINRFNGNEYIQLMTSKLTI